MTMAIPEIKSESIPSLKELFEFIHTANRLSIEAGYGGVRSGNKGCYITAQKGLALRTVFIGVNSITGQCIVEITS